jgi:hypothetical protein
MPPEIHSHGPKSANFRQSFDIGLCLSGRSYRRRRLPSRRLALRHFLTGFLKHGARPNTLAGNNQRTADLAGKAANSRVLRTVSLFANGTSVIFGTRRPGHFCEHCACNKHPLGGSDLEGFRQTLNPFNALMGLSSETEVRSWLAFGLHERAAHRHHSPRHAPHC